MKHALDKRTRPPNLVCNLRQKSSPFKSENQRLSRAKSLYLLVHITVKCKSGAATGDSEFFVCNG